MKTVTLSLIAFLFCLVLQAQVTLPYFTGFDDSQQQNGWVQHRKGVIDPFYEWEYIANQAYSSPNCLIHYYPVGGSQVSDDWFVSPEFDISGGGLLDSLRYAFSGFGVPGAGDTVFVYLLNGSDDPDLATTSILYEFSGANYQNDNTWRLLGPINLPAQSGESHIAFRYKTINNWLDTRFDNVRISGSGSAQLPDILATAFGAYPNPSAGAFRFRLPDNFKGTTPQLEIFTTSGALAFQETIQDDLPVETNLGVGFYTYRLTTDEAVFLGKLVVR